jgi:NTP pyrophosphatase (non-canonical NTP hydrolase)
VSLLQQAIEFRKKFNQPIYAEPQHGKTLAMQVNLIDEEFHEFMDSDTGSENELKELADLVYVCFQFAAAFGLDLDEALRRIHVSNMSKLTDEGFPLIREDGKILKGPNYKAPDLSDLVQGHG